MLHQLPPELLECVYARLDVFDLCALATLNRHLHFTALHHLFSRYSVFDPVRLSVTFPRTLTLSPKESFAVIQALMMALSFPFPPKLLECTVENPFPRVCKDLVKIRRLIEKVNSIEAVEFHFLLYEDFERHRRRFPKRRTSIITLVRDLLDVVAFKSPCRKVTLVGAVVLPHADPFRDIHGKYPRLNNLVGFGRRFLFPNSLSNDVSKQSNLRVLNIHGSLSFHRTIAEWTFKLLTSPSVEVLSLRDTELGYYLWETILPRIYLPNLKELYLNNTMVDRTHITTFLTRHPSLVRLDLGFSGTTMDPTWPSPPRHLLPNVTWLEGDPRFLGFFLHSHTSLPKVRELVINIIVPNIILFKYLSRALPHVEPRLRQLNVTLQLSLHGGPGSINLPWTQSDEEIPSCCDHIKKLVILTFYRRLMKDDGEVEGFLVWMKRFKEVECIAFEECHKEVWNGAVMKRLARGLMKRESELKVRTLQLNDEAKPLEEWSES
ncbi:hypothetical protein BDN72DRAFT_905806 [Pluteus cervinus]|uniref:Uncharacterized protein n=1 Tax=Pluteus cervinus TaxID=181527 RepID=A0ACD3A0Z7_9AGAR|nr:hypothetical protein BDN72DRAFT_905806 [Pluteus cervinus]